MTTFAPFVDQIAGRGAAAWEIHTRALARAEAGADILFLSVGDPEFGTPEVVTDAAVEGLRAGRTHYTPILGETAFRRAVADWHAQLTGQTVKPDNVAAVAGAQNGLFTAMLCVVPAGAEVIVPEPMYATYEAVVGAAGATVVPVPLRPERGFHPDPADVEAAVSPATRAILLNTPHNPAGAVMDREELAAIADTAKRHDLWVISDEVYASLTFERAHVSPASLPDMGERTVVVSSLSKSHAMTGWRVGWLVGPESLIEPHVANLLLCMLYGLPGYNQDAGLAAITRASGDLDAMRAEYRARRDTVHAALADVPGLRCHRPEGGMFVMVDIRDTGRSAFDFAAGLLDDEGVSVLPGDGFGPSAAGHVRLSLTANRERLNEACTRIARHAARLLQEVEPSA